MVELIRRLRRPGRTILALKRATTVTKVDQPGTDTSRFAAAGADVIGLTWPAGTYVAQPTGEPPRPVAGCRLDRPLSLTELTALALDARPPAGQVLVLAEGFSDAPYARIHLRARPGRPERPAGGPVLGAWSLDEGRPGAVAELVDVSLPLIARWSGLVEAPRPVAAVLAGGQGRRLGGLDKWKLEIGGRSLAGRCLETLAEVFDEILVVGRRPPEVHSRRESDVRRESDAWPESGVRPEGDLQPEGDSRVEGARRRVTWLTDRVPGLGPLGGLLTALTAAAGRPVFVVGGDMPFLSPAFIRHLLFTAERVGRFDVLLPSWRPGSGPECGLPPAYDEPLHAVYAGDSARHLEELLEAGRLAGCRMTAAFDGLRVVRVPDAEIRLFGNPELLFFNLNTPADLDRAVRLLQA